MVHRCLATWLTLRGLGTRDIGGTCGFVSVGATDALAADAALRSAA